MDLHIDKTTLQLPGLQKTYQFYHISDAHFSYAEESDPEGEKMITARDNEQYATAPGNAMPLEVWDTLMDYLKKDPNTDGLLITGDMFNFFNLSTHRKIQKMLADCPIETFYTPGNHEFCNPMDLAYTEEDKTILVPTTPETDINNIYHRYYDEYMNGDPDFWVRDFGDFLLIGINNQSHDITPEQMAKLKEQASRQFPILLMMHVALYSDAYADVIRQNWVGLNMYFVFENNDLPSNKEFSDFVRSPESHVAAVIAGHVHAAHEGEYAPGKMQYVAAPLYKKYVRKLTLVPRCYASTDEQKSSQPFISK